MSVEQLITDNIDIWTSAIKTKSASGRGSSNKLELYGIKKLRELILELAVRGKLVPQDSNDEPASKLLERIAAEKEQLIKDKKIKKQKPLPSIAEDEKPFELPLGWAWCHLQNVGSILGGGTPKSSEPKFWNDSGIKWLTPADLYGRSEKYICAGKRDISPLGLEKSSAQLLPTGSVLFSSRAPIGYVAITSSELATNQGFKSVVPFIDGLSDYLYYFLKRSAKIIDASASGTTFKEVSGAVVSQIKTPLPPLEEQKRIVAKVDELMALCDQLELQTEASIETHRLLVKTLLETLTNAKDVDELNDSWLRISEHFDVLLTTEDSIDQLKQTILQLAVMGKLVKQDPNDEPASILLERIAADKEQLIKDKKIKKQKSLPPIAEDEKPFDLPDGWTFARFGNVFLLEYGNNLPQAKRSETGEYSVYGSNGIVGTHNEFCVDGPCIVVGRKGSAGALNLCLDRGCWVTDVAYSVTLSEHLSVGFIFNLFQTLGLDNLGKGIKPGLNRNDAYDLPIAVPPLKEQKRIVAKVEALMTLCDTLKGRLKDAQTIQLHLTDEIVEQAS